MGWVIRINSLVGYVDVEGHPVILDLRPEVMWYSTTPGPTQKSSHLHKSTKKFLIIFLLKLLMLGHPVSQRPLNGIEPRVSPTDCSEIILICHTLFAHNFSTLFVMVVFSQFLGRLQVPCPVYSKKRGWRRTTYPMFQMYSVNPRPSTITAVYNISWTSGQIRKIAGCACAGNTGNVFPITDFKGNRYLVIPACITASVSRTCHEACRDR